MRALVGLLTIGAVACTRPPPTQGPVPPQRPVPALVQVERSLDLDGTAVGASDAPATLLVSFASWCVHCKHELAILGALRTAHPRVRILGVNYKAHEEYANRGSPAALRAFLAESAPWLRVVPIGDDVFRALGSPPKVPTMYVFDRGGALVETYDRRARDMPDAAELAALFARLGG